jgi:hypothetical protein
LISGYVVVPKHGEFGSIKVNQGKRFGIGGPMVARVEGGMDESHRIGVNPTESGENGLFFSALNRRLGGIRKSMRIRADQTEEGIPYRGIKTSSAGEARERQVQSKRIIVDYSGSSISVVDVSHAEINVVGIDLEMTGRCIGIAAFRIIDCELRLRIAEWATIRGRRNHPRSPFSPSFRVPPEAATT